MYAIRNVSLLDAHTFVKEGAIIVRGNKIEFAGEYKSLSQNVIQSHNWKDGKGAWVTPGFINSHTHVALCFLREIAHTKSDMISSVFFPIEKKLTPEDVYAFSFPSILAGLKSGVTTFVDHYYEISAVIQALEEVGVRGFVGETLGDIGGARPFRRDPYQFIDNENWNKSQNKLVRKILAPHAMDTVSIDYMKDMVKISDEFGVPMHMHLSQTQKERDFCIEKYGRSPVQVALDTGALSSRALVVHLVSADSEDSKLLEQANATVGLCPTSQIIYEKVAQMPLFQKLNKGLGTDCAASHDSMDIMSELKVLYLVSKMQGCSMSAQDVLKSVWDGPAQWLGAPLGKLEKGYFADLVFFIKDLDCEPCYEPHLHLITTLTSRHIEAVMINGEYRLGGNSVQAFDSEKVRQKFFESLSKFKLNSI